MSDKSYWLGVDLGGTSAKGAALRSTGELLGEWHQAFQPDVRLAFVPAVKSLIEAAEAQLGRPKGIGLSAPGFAALSGDRIAAMPGRLPGLEGLVWNQAVGWPGILPVLNDAQAALLGETTFGDERGVKDAVLLTLGTGVGGAALCGGQLLRGHTGKAGHFGHMSLDPSGKPDICGAPGSLEDQIGNHNIVQRSRGEFSSTHQLVASLRKGDLQAGQIWTSSVRALAAAIVSLGNALDPEVVIIGGGVADAGPDLFDPLTKLVRAMEWRPIGQGMRIVPASLGAHAGAWGAAAQAMKAAAGAQEALV